MLSRFAKKWVHRTIAHVVAAVLRPGATIDPVNFRLWERRGYHIIPNHFYYPVPDLATLANSYRERIPTPGLDLRPDFQRRLLEKTFPRFAEEYNAFPVKPTSKPGFHLDNDAFTGIDPAVYLSMIRWLRPKTILEIGSGHSTLLGAHAAEANGETRLICIDPYPRDFVAQGIPKVSQILKPVESMDIAIFQQLQKDDILFVDSSHVVRTGGDLNFIVLEILPSLAKGVVVHFHDVYIPFEYPRELIFTNHFFWTEQYLLQAYLAENAHAEILFGTAYAVHEFPDLVRKTFPNALFWGGASFWLRKT
jgi:hypothetical protein